MGQGYTIFDFRVFTRELINLFPTLNENFDFFLSFFFSDTVKAGSVKLCMIITFARGLHFHAPLGNSPGELLHLLLKRLKVCLPTFTCYCLSTRKSCFQRMSVWITSITSSFKKKKNYEHVWLDISQGNGQDLGISSRPVLALVESVKKWQNGILCRSAFANCMGS